ncbi:MAG: DUF2262 domain-containing protein [Butyrivibrio sp.]|nr:DUF2262 domain-containing protein [Butyrivibrio sp.]
MEIVFNEEEGRYECQTDLALCYTVSGEGEDVPGAKALMEKLLPMLPELDKKSRNYAADELLETKNDVWLEEDEEPISKEDFVDTLILKKVEFNAEGVTFWYDDGDLFWGHYVTVDSSADGTPKYAQMMG